MTTTDKQITVERTVNASAGEIFDVLTRPDRHAAIDGSGFVRSADHPQRITATGQTFTMNMTGEHMGGDYQTDNHVIAYHTNKLVGWQTSPTGTEPPGWEWLWELAPEGPDSTVVTLTYDWSKVTDKDVLRQVSFPMVTEEQLEESLANLAEAVSS